MVDVWTNAVANYAAISGTIALQALGRAGLLSATEIDSLHEAGWHLDSAISHPNHQEMASTIQKLLAQIAEGRTPEKS